MINVVAEGPLPLSVDDWIDALSRGWTNESPAANADDKSKATEPPSLGKLYDPLASPCLGESYDPADVDAGNKDPPGWSPTKPAA